MIRRIRQTWHRIGQLPGYWAFLVAFAGIALPVAACGSDEPYDTPAPTVVPAATITTFTGPTGELITCVITSTGAISCPTTEG